MRAGGLVDRMGFVIGVDTHRASHTLSVVDSADGERGHFRLRVPLHAPQRLRARS